MFSVRLFLHCRQLRIIRARSIYASESLQDVVAAIVRNNSGTLETFDFPIGVNVEVLEALSECRNLVSVSGVGVWYRESRQQQQRQRYSDVALRSAAGWGSVTSISLGQHLSGDVVRRMLTRGDCHLTLPACALALLHASQIGR
jgi:hypothetical protein